MCQHSDHHAFVRASSFTFIPSWSLPTSSPQTHPSTCFTRPAHSLPLTVRPRTRSIHLPRTNNTYSPPRSELSSPASNSSNPNALSTLLETATTLFPVWVVLGAIVAYIRPATFLWFGPNFIVPTLAIIMLGMGLTIPFEAFSAILKEPRRVFMGAAAQYSVMPLLAFALSKYLRLPVPLAVGVILVGVCPGGAASNLVCLIGGADVALSVVLTLVSTLLSVILIPLLMKMLAGTLVPISPLALLLSTAQVVIVPLMLGLVLKSRFPRAVRKVSAGLPLVSVICVSLICSAVVAANASALTSVGPKLVFALSCLHAFGGLLGYVIGRVFRLPERSSRTLSIEVMMQNSTLAVSLANSHFANPITAVPGAISATMHSIMGSILAGAWRIADSSRACQETTASRQIAGNGDVESSGLDGYRVLDE